MGLFSMTTLTHECTSKLRCRRRCRSHASVLSMDVMSPSSSSSSNVNIPKNPLKCRLNKQNHIRLIYLRMNMMFAIERGVAWINSSEKRGAREIQKYFGPLHLAQLQKYLERTCILTWECRSTLVGQQLWEILFLHIFLVLQLSHVVFIAHNLKMITGANC